MASSETERLKEAVELLLQRGNELFSCPCVQPPFLLGAAEAAAEGAATVVEKEPCVKPDVGQLLSKSILLLEEKPKNISTGEELQEDDDFFEII